jgi:hypothetical protein
MQQDAIMGLAQSQRRYSPEEYYAREQGAAFKSDYFDGEIFSMAGGMDAHSAISGNIIIAVGSRLRGSDCVIRESNLRLKVQAIGLITFPMRRSIAARRNSHRTIRRATRGLIRR